MPRDLLPAPVAIPGAKARCERLSLCVRPAPVLERIGWTPLVELRGVSEEGG